MKETKIICKNIFKNGEKQPTKEIFTDKWIALIRLLEKNNIKSENN